MSFRYILVWKHKIKPYWVNNTIGVACNSSKLSGKWLRFQISFVVEALILELLMHLNGASTNIASICTWASGPKGKWKLLLTFWAHFVSSFDSESPQMPPLDLLKYSHSKKNSYCTNSEYYHYIIAYHSLSLKSQRWIFLFTLLIMPFHKFKCHL